MPLALGQKEGSDTPHDLAGACRCAEALTPSCNHKSLVHFLALLVLIHMLFSVGGFVCLYHIYSREEVPLAEGAGTSLAEEISKKTSAHMVPGWPSVQQSQRSLSGHLQWDMTHSIFRNVNFYEKSWLTVLQSGDYYVFSRVTFSKANPRSPLTSILKLRKSVEAEETEAMLAYCYAATLNPCTATQGGVMMLESGDQLSVWVDDVSLVDYSEGATAFGMYKL